MTTTAEQHDAMIRTAQESIDAYGGPRTAKELLPILIDTFAWIDELTNSHPDSTLCGHVCGMKLLLNELVATEYGLTPRSPP